MSENNSNSNGHSKGKAAIRDRITEFRRVKRDDILPNAHNWRKHPEPQREALRGLLSEIGVAGVGLAYYSERNGGKLTLIDGHLRREEIPDNLPVAITDLSDAEADLLLASYDPLAAMATADKAALDKLLHEVSTGDAALSQMLTNLAKESGLSYGAEPAQAPEPQVDKAAELQAKWKTERGQLWEIGRHRLLCGDSTDRADVEWLLAGAKPHLMVTDPPYGVDYDPNWRNEAKRPDGTPYGAASLGTVENDQRSSWPEAFQLFPGAACYVWHASASASAVRFALDLMDAGFEIRNQIIWKKPAFAISRGHYHWQHEPCWYGVRKGKRSQWIGDRSQSTLWDISNHQDDHTDHGTQKPLECMARPIRNHEGDVYDPFVGVGTTIVAAEQLNRKCYAIDIDPKWVAVSLQRLADMGLEPKLMLNRETALA